MVVTVIIRLRQRDYVAACKNILNQNLVGVGLVALNPLYLQRWKGAKRDGKRPHSRSQTEEMGLVVKSDLAPRQCLSRGRIPKIDNVYRADRVWLHGPDQRADGNYGSPVCREAYVARVMPGQERLGARKLFGMLVEREGL